MLVIGHALPQDGQSAVYGIIAMREASWSCGWQRVGIFETLSGSRHLLGCIFADEVREWDNLGGASAVTLVSALAEW